MIREPGAQATFKLSTHIGCREDSRVWDAVRKDDDHIVMLLKETLSNNIGQQTALSLREGAAESFLTLITKVGRCAILS